MKLQNDTIENIHRKMDKVKSNAFGTFFTNYFRQEMSGTALLSASTEQTALFVNDEIDFYRMYFLTTDLEDLDHMLRDLEFSGTIIVSYLAKKPEKKIQDLFNSVDFEHIATFNRMTNTNLRISKVNNTLQFAEPSDRDLIYQGLLNALNKYTDHFPTPQRLSEYIANNQVLVNKKSGKICGCLIFQLQGKRVNFNYLYNFSDNTLDALALQMNFYGLMNEKEIHSGFLWVNTRNTGVIKMHQKFGWQFDGLDNYYFLKKFKSKEN